MCASRQEKKWSPKGPRIVPQVHLLPMSKGVARTAGSWSQHCRARIDMYHSQVGGLCNGYPTHDGFKGERADQNHARKPEGPQLGE